MIVLVASMTVVEIMAVIRDATRSTFKVITQVEMVTNAPVVVPKRVRHVRMQRTVLLANRDTGVFIVNTTAPAVVKNAIKMKAVARIAFAVISIKLPKPVVSV